MISTEKGTFQFQKDLTGLSAQQGLLRDCFLCCLKSRTSVIPLFPGQLESNFHKSSGVSYSTALSSFRSYIFPSVLDGRMYSTHSIRIGVANDTAFRSLDSMLLDQHIGWKYPKSKFWCLEAVPENIVQITHAIFRLRASRSVAYSFHFWQSPACREVLSIGLVLFPVVPAASALGFFHPLDAHRCFPMFILSSLFCLISFTWNQIYRTSWGIQALKSVFVCFDYSFCLF